MRALIDTLHIALQHLLPQHLLSALAWRLTRSRAGAIRVPLIAAFIRAFDVDMEEAVEPDPRAYGTFNEFFTRALREGARPVCNEPGTVISPVDGQVSQAGAISGGRILQAKGHDYTVAALLGGLPAPAADRYAAGSFVTLYLSPRDYHRIHMPVTGRLRSAAYVPGALFPVNRASTSRVDGLFARNERILLEFEGSFGAMVLCMVGAIFVGSMETIWHGQVTPARDRSPRPLAPVAGAPATTCAAGQEIARFNMGSTVILLFEPGRLQWSEKLVAGTPVRMGQAMGRLQG